MGEPVRAWLAKLRTASGARKCAESAPIRSLFDRTTNGHLRWWELAFLLPILRSATSAMYESSQFLADNLVAARMWTTRSVVSRLESGVRTRPTVTTIERFAHRRGCHGRNPRAANAVARPMKGRSAGVAYLLGPNSPHGARLVWAIQVFLLDLFP
jgi:hypothetical protein